MSTTQSYTYEDLPAKIETSETPESHRLLVHVPKGFTRGDIGAKVEYDFGRVRVFGERSTENNKRSRFNEKYQVPSYCDIGNIKGKFDGETITITMPIIPGAKVPPKQEQEAPQPEPVVQESQPKDQGNDKEDDNNAAAEVKDQKGDQQDTSDHQDPKSTVESKDDAAAHVTSTTQEEQKVSMLQKGQQEISQEAQVSKVESKGEADHETSTTQEATMPQKGQEEISQKAQVTKVESKREADHETSTTQEQESSMPQKGQEEISQKAQVTKVESKREADHETSTTQEQESSMPQKGQEEISQKAQATKVESKREADHEISTTPEATEDSMPQKGEEKDTATKDAKLQTEENTAGLNDENMKKQRVRKEETKDHHKKTTVESGKLPEKESKEESKVSAATVESVTTKITEKGKEMMNGKLGDDAEKKSEKRGIPESTRTRIKDLATSTTQAVTNLAKRFSEEDKQKLIYTGAAILVVGLGVYASYKYRSSRKP